MAPPIDQGCKLLVQIVGLLTKMEVSLYGLHIDWNNNKLIRLKESTLTQDHKCKNCKNSKTITPSRNTSSKEVKNSRSIIRLVMSFLVYRLHRLYTYSRKIDFYTIRPTCNCYKCSFRIMASFPIRCIIWYRYPIHRIWSNFEPGKLVNGKRTPGVRILCVGLLEFGRTFDEFCCFQNGNRLV